MKGNDIMKKARDIIAVMGTTLILLVLAGFVPVASLVFLICSGIPFAVFSAKYDLKFSVPVLMVTGFVYWFAAGHWANAVTTVAVAVLPGLVAGYMLGRKQLFYSALLATCAFVGLGWILEFSAMDRIFGVSVDDLLNGIVEGTRQTMSAMVSQVTKTGLINNGVDLNGLFDEAIAMMNLMIHTYFPSFIVVLSMLMGYVTLRLSGFAIRKTKTAEVRIVEFSMMRAPRSMTWIAVLLYLVYVFSEQGSAFWVVLANAVFILYTIIAVCGFSIFDFMLAKVVKPAILRVLIYVATFLVAGLIFGLVIDLLVIAGILDSSRDFRKLGRIEE
ncbi:MAG: DUF2232 domain-containing protein [Clostridia bacterium]|nr:DUF2232 domain-containing protein [Clostridia bacterium]